MTPPMPALPASTSTTYGEDRLLRVFLNGLPGTTLLAFRYSRGEYHLSVRIGNAVQSVSHHDFFRACAAVQTLHDTLTAAPQQDAA